MDDVLVCRVFIDRGEWGQEKEQVDATVSCQTEHDGSDFINTDTITESVMMAGFTIICR